MSKNFHDYFVNEVSDKAFETNKLNDMLNKLRSEWNRPELSWNTVFHVLEILPFVKFAEYCIYCRDEKTLKDNLDNPLLKTNECGWCGHPVCMLHTIKCSYCSTNVGICCLDDSYKQYCCGCYNERNKPPPPVYYSDEESLEFSE